PMLTARIANGPGTRPHDSTAGGGSGLRGLGDRIESLGGVLSFEHGAEGAVLSMSIDLSGGYSDD
ncbi:MAG: hypothetical protein WAT70_01150, partial [Rhizobiaceae bacterium]